MSSWFIIKTNGLLSASYLSDISRNQDILKSETMLYSNFSAQLSIETEWMFYDIRKCYNNLEKNTIVTLDHKKILY